MPNLQEISDIQNILVNILENSKKFTNFAPKSTYSKTRVEKEKSTSLIGEDNHNRCSSRRQSLGESE